ncbi:unnamed protein product [Sphagnum jensenii]|uniref:Flowering time control protein FY n=1 Tax=Sphagnum jensenii TaxID=128206 RepID=A0ABP0WC98_9BRYO
MEGHQMQFVQQGHNFHRPLAVVPVPPAPPSTPAVGADFNSRPKDVIFDGKWMQKPIHHRTVDYSSTVVCYIQVFCKCSSAVDLLPTVAYPDKPATSFTTEFIHPSTNKVPCLINRVLWTPTGRRLITGSQSGEFTLWNGQSFNFEMILQAHDQAVWSMIWSHNENWMVTGDDGGCIKYWQTNMNNVKANKTAHKEAVCDLSFSSTDLKFCSCSDDTTIKVWDFAQCQEECSLARHGWDVKSVDSHPQKSLMVSGVLTKQSSELLEINVHGHKNTVLTVKWNSNGNWVLTASWDQTIKGTCFIPTMRTSGSKKTWVSLKWRGNRHEGQQAEVANAHESSVWDLAWHPTGHILCSGSNDHTTKFWCRNRPSETLHDNRHNNVHSQGNASESQAVGLSTPGAIAGGGPVCGEGAIPGVRMTLSLDPAGANRSVVQNMMPTSNPPILHGPYPPTTPCPTSVCQLQQQQPPLLPRPLPCLQPPPRPPPSAAWPLDLPGCGMMMSTQTMHNPRPISQGSSHLWPPLGPTLPMGPLPMWDFVAPGGFRAWLPSMGGLPRPYMLMPNTMVPGQHLYVGLVAPNIMDMQAYGMAMGMSMNVPMGMNMGLPLHPHPPGPPHV